MVQSPYKVPQADRYTYDAATNTHICWQQGGRLAFEAGNGTDPRTEMRWEQEWTSGKHMLDADVWIAGTTNRTNITQVFSTTPPTTFMLTAWADKTLRYYFGTGNGRVIMTDAFEKWFNLKVLHDVSTHTVTVFINDVKSMSFPDKGSALALQRTATTAAAACAARPTGGICATGWRPKARVGSPRTGHWSRRSPGWGTVPAAALRPSSRSGAWWGTPPTQIARGRRSDRGDPVAQPMTDRSCISGREIVIPGGSGQVGSILARAFHADGDEVVVLGREFRATPWRTVRWEPTEVGAWMDEVDGADVVINLAGRSVNCRYGARNRREILESRLSSVAAIARAIARARRPPATWLQASTATIYAHRYDVANDEASASSAGPSVTCPRAGGSAPVWRRPGNGPSTTPPRRTRARSSSAPRW